MKWTKLCSFVTASLLCLGMVSCSDDNNYFESDIMLPLQLGAPGMSFSDLWQCNQPNLLVKTPNSGRVTLDVPAKGGKYVLTINPECTYNIITNEPDQQIFGPYDIPQTLYPVPDCVYETNVEKPVYYACSPAESGVWLPSFSSPLKSPYGKFYMEKNKLTLELKEAPKGSLELALRVAICKELTYPPKMFAAEVIYIRQGK